MRNYFIPFFCLMMLGCSGQSKDYLADDIRLFEGEVAPLARAVLEEDTSKIIAIANGNKHLVNYQEPKFGQTLLHWSVKVNKLRSIKALLDNGADPDLQDTYDGSSPLMYASGYGKDYDTSSVSLKLLLKYGASPNTIQKTLRAEGNRTRKTPLIIATSCCLNKTKILVESGADINYKNEFQESPLESAMRGGKDAVYITRYLLIEKNAIIPKSLKTTESGKEITVLDYLRDWLFPLDSKEYKAKMEIIHYLKDKGLDYWSTPVPKRYFKSYTKEYLEKY